MSEITNQMNEVNLVIKKPTLYDSHIKENFHIYGIASILYGILYVFCMFKNDAGITYPIFVGATIGYILFAIRKLEMQLKKESRFYIVSMILLGISTFCTDDPRIIFFNKTGVFLLAICLILGLFYDTTKWNLGKYIGSIIQVCATSLMEVNRPFADAVWFCKNKLGQKNSKYLYLLIGLGITIPVFLVVFLLLTSADAVFRDWANQIFADIAFSEYILMVMMFLWMMFVSYCLLVKFSKNELKEEVKDSKKWEPLIGIPLATVLSLLYLVFSGIQIVYLFMGNMQLPEGYTYAEYAREGFFQLLAVSIINLIIVLIGLCYFKPNKVFKAILTVMSLCTFIMIASSGMRMIIYIQYYYLTFLRILVLWSLAVLTLIFIGVIAYTAKSSFPLFRYSLFVFTCFYIGLSFSHPDYWISKINLESTKETRSEFFQGDAYEDYELLGNLSADAAPIMLKWFKEEGFSTEIYKGNGMTFDEYLSLNGIVISGEKQTDEEIREYDKCVVAYSYLTNLCENCRDMGVREFNISRYVADYVVTHKGSEIYAGFVKDDYVVVEENDSHGGFHGDGMYYLVLDCSKNQESTLEIVSGWKELPLSKNIKLMIYGGTADEVVYMSEIANAAKIPTVENGYYYFCDRHSQSTDADDDTNLLNRASFNFTLAIYDCDTDTLYYVEYDT